MTPATPGMTPSQALEQHGSMILAVAVDGVFYPAWVTQKHAVLFCDAIAAPSSLPPGERDAARKALQDRAEAFLAHVDRQEVPETTFVLVSRGGPGMFMHYNPRAAIPRSLFSAWRTVAQNLYPEWRGALAVEACSLLEVHAGNPPVVYHTSVGRRLSGAADMDDPRGGGPLPAKTQRRRDRLQRRARRG